MSAYDDNFLKNYSFFTYVYMISKIDKYNKHITDKFDNVEELYNGNNTFNVKLIEKIINDDYLDYTKLKCINMFIEYLLYWTNKNISIDDDKKRYKFLSYFMNNIDQVISNMKYKETDSAEGFIVFSDFLNLKNKLVIKTPRDNSDARKLLFEYYIGYNFINKLREKTPNFMHTYGIFMCNPLLQKKSIFSDKMMVTNNFCKDDMKSNIYVLFEKIDGISLYDYIQNITKQEELDNVINFILQIMFSLDIAQREGDYVHNDLHINNIMIRKINKSINHDYIIDNYKYTMKLDSIATVIDYGMNRFVENGVPLGTTTFENLGFNPYTNCTSNDVYKSLMTIVTSLVTLHATKKLSFVNSIDNTIDFIISFFRGKIDYYNVVKSWDAYFKNKNNVSTSQKTYNKFIENLKKNSKTYFSPYPVDIVFFNTVTPKNFIQYVKDEHPNLWNKHVQQFDIKPDEIGKSYVKVYNPYFNEDEYNDYEFSNMYNDIHITKFVNQKQLFYKLFNSNYKQSFDRECLIDQKSMIMNLNTFVDCKNIIDLLGSNSNTQIEKDYDIINEYKKETMKNLKTYFQNDIDSLYYHMEQMNKVDKLINYTLLKSLDKDDLKVEMKIFTEQMKNETKKIHMFLDNFEKYLLLTNCFIHLSTSSLIKNVLNEYNFSFDKKPFSVVFDKFIPDINLFEKANKLSNYLKNYYRIVNEYYSMRMVEETNVYRVNPFTFYNLCVTLENMHPLLSDIFKSYANGFININSNLSLVTKFHYVPVNSDTQFFNYLNLDYYNNQIHSLVNLVSRFTISNPYNLKQLFNKKDQNGNSSDILIYDEMRKIRKQKDPSKKERRNQKRAKEVYDFIERYSDIPIKSDQYLHLDYGGNDGSVASEIAKLMNLDKTQIYSADIEKWLGNVKNIKYDNITYTMLGENEVLPYKNNSFDSISCLQVLHHIDFANTYIKELHRVLKPGGIVILKEHDCVTPSHQFLIDIEHVIHEYVEPDIPNTDILNTYCAFYKSFNDLNKIFEMLGFELVTEEHDFNIRYNPTRYYFSIYRKK